MHRGKRSNLVWSLAALVCCAVQVVGSAQSVPSDRSAAAESWTVTRADGTVRRLAIVSLQSAPTSTTSPAGDGPSDPGRLVLSDGSELPLTDVLRLERGEVPPAGRGANYTGLVLILRDGQRLTGEPGAPAADGDAESVAWVHPQLGTMRFPLKDVAEVRRVGVGVPRALPSGEALLPAGDTPTEDSAALLNGDTVRGVVSGVTADSVLLLTPSGDSQSVPWRSLRHLRLAAVGNTISVPRPGYRIELLDGTVVQTPDLQIDSGSVRLRAGSKVRVGDVVLVERAGFSAWPLTLLPMAEIQHVAFLSVTRPPRIDASAGGGPLRRSEASAGSTLLRGLGLTARTRIVYPIPDGFAVLRLGYQRDPSAERGAAVLRVLGNDNAVLFEDLDVRSAEPRTASVDLKGATRLTIEVDFGGSAGVQPWVNLIEPLLLRK